MGVENFKKLRETDESDDVTNLDETSESTTSKERLLGDGCEGGGGGLISHVNYCRSMIVMGFGSKDSIRFFEG